MNGICLETCWHGCDGRSPAQKTIIRFYSGPVSGFGKTIWPPRVRSQWQDSLRNLKSHVSRDNVQIPVIRVLGNCERVWALQCLEKGDPSPELSQIRPCEGDPRIATLARLNHQSPSLDILSNSRKRQFRKWGEKGASEHAKYWRILWA
jgi:hypothetical protein